MENELNFSCTTYFEVKTVTGKMIDIQCRPEDKDKIKEIFKYVYHIDCPVTKEVKNISHGGFGRLTRFDIIQHKYAGGGCGFIEALEVKNPPDNRCGNIVHEYTSGYSTYWEFDTIENAIEAWSKHWGNHYMDSIKKEPGFIREVKCCWFSPWFYAIANQALNGDFCFPDRVGIDHPIYRPYNRFVIKDRFEDLDEPKKKTVIKTCIL